MWTTDESSSLVAEKAWDIQVKGSHCFQLAKKMKKVRLDLRLWNKKCFGNVKSKIKELENRIEEVRGLEQNK